MDLLGVSEAAYIDLVAYSGQQYRLGKAALMLKPQLVNAMKQHESGDWLDAQNVLRLSYRAVGSAPKMIELAERLQRRWVKRTRRVLVERQA